MTNGKYEENVYSLFALRAQGRPGRIIIIIDKFCIAPFSDVHKLTMLYNILQHFLSVTNIIHIIMTTNTI